ncbi:hypothetical protein FRC14_000372 [Serendipita sp. 396]|nr:hypothetical protein FRC14_000372 [Serendipita sp. 396]KAG8776755.1 hypothetical protein FRC15_011782 [Serendipita sp. 397]KAG8794104.1 hypothetical protein FRC16_010706 [Serendipita sp. 398]KAG8819466.1 hypothetical protein FRC18_012085 [Serendipita sp. 400]KAG8846013.1 hypothetical protein FRB91_001260 [Serendipita sp. 411]KAG8857893.1 hypothetical protein FRC20_000188 [Serendipita sp. 405]
MEDKVTWITAELSMKARTSLMEAFRAGDIWILFCTDAVGMGMDIPDICLVVQYGLPNSLVSLFQRIGRGARDVSLRTYGLVLYDQKQLPKSHRSAPKRKARSDINPRPSKQQVVGKIKLESRDNPPSQTLEDEDQSGNESIEGDVAEANQVPATSAVTKKKPIRYKQEIEPALLEFVTPKDAVGAKPPACRALVTYRYFGNNQLPTLEDCCSRCKDAALSDGKCHRCDLCNPHLLDDLLQGFVPPPPPRQRRFAIPKKAGDPEKEELLRKKLTEWRLNKSLAEDNGFGPVYFLSDGVLQRILGVSRHSDGSPSSVPEFMEHITWSHSTFYAEELLPIIHSVYPSRLTLTSERAVSTIPSTSLDPTALEGTSTIKKRRPRPPLVCSRCKQPGHRSMTFLLLRSVL